MGWHLYAYGEGHPEKRAEDGSVSYIQPLLDRTENHPLSYVLFLLVLFP